MCVVKLYGLNSLLCPGGEGAVQPSSCPERTQHGGRGVVTPPDAITSDLSAAAGSSLLVQQAGVEHSVFGDRRRLSAPPLAIPARLGRAAGLVGHGDGHHRRSRGWGQKGGVLNLERKKR